MKQCPCWPTGREVMTRKDIAFLVIDLHPGHVKDLTSVVT